MPIKDHQQNTRSFIQMAQSWMTRAEFRDAFQNVSRLISKAIGELEARVNKRLDDLTRTEQELSARIDKKIRGVDGYTPVKGKDYFDGKDGYTPVKGKDYFDGRDGLTPVAGVHFPMPKDGKNADPKVAAGLAIPKIIAELEKRLPSMSEALRTELKADLNTFLSRVDFGPGGGTSFSIMQSGTQKVQQPLALNFKGTNAPTISLGQNGVTNLDFSAGGTQVYEEVVSFSGTTGTLAHTPTSAGIRLYRGGARQQAGIGKDYTLSGATITLSTAAASGEIFLADYTY